MPQLDVISFRGQATWIVLIFSGYYARVLAELLPVLNRSTKMRVRKIGESRSRVANSDLSLSVGHYANAGSVSGQGLLDRLARRLAEASASTTARLRRHVPLSRSRLSAAVKNVIKPVKVAKPSLAAAVSASAPTASSSAVGKATKGAKAPLTGGSTTTAARGANKKRSLSTLSGSDSSGNGNDVKSTSSVSLKNDGIISSEAGVTTVKKTRTKVAKTTTDAPVMDLTGEAAVVKKVRKPRTKKGVDAASEAPSPDIQATDTTADGSVVKKARKPRAKKVVNGVTETSAANDTGLTGKTDSSKGS